MTAAALVAGLATCLHCAGMCEPIACGLGRLAKTEGERLTAASLQLGSRLVSSGLIGALRGALGQQPLKWFSIPRRCCCRGWWWRFCFGLDKKAARPLIFQRLTARV